MSDLVGTDTSARKPGSQFSWRGSGPVPHASVVSVPSKSLTVFLRVLRTRQKPRPAASEASEDIE